MADAPSPTGQQPQTPAGLQAEMQAAVALHQRGQTAEAERLYRAILGAEPRHSDALHYLGVILMDRGSYAPALELLGKAVALNPNDYAALFNHANVLDILGRREEALASFDRAIFLRPDFAEALYNRGNLMRDLNRPKAAIQDYEAAIRVRPTYVEAWSNRAAVLLGVGNFAEALVSCDEAIALKPGFRVLYNRGNALRALERPAEAVASFDQAVAMKPDFAEAWHNRGAALMDLRRFEPALASFDRAIALKPDYAEAFASRGAALRELAQLDASIASYDRAIALKPDDAEYRRNRGLTRLLAGQLAEGWRDHEQRWRSPAFAVQRLPLAVPQWAGEDLAGKSILVHAEQGIGDILQFCRYLPMLAERSGEVVFLGPNLLLSLLRTLPGNVRLVGSIERDARFDFLCPLMSLPLGFATDLGSIPATIPYLAATPERVAYWGRRLAAAGFKIGIAWQGNPKGMVDIGRSIPLRAFEPLSQVPGVTLISLQKHHGLDQLAALPSGMRVETLGDFDAGADAFVDTAAVMQHLDLVVTLDSAIAHLSGALGRPTWVALRSVPDWRWMLGRADSPWYPTLRLFRQARPEDWSDVFAAIAAALRARVGATGTAS